MRLPERQLENSRSEAEREGVERDIPSAKRGGPERRGAQALYKQDNSGPSPHVSDP
jgi:hypothetical protein